MMTIMKMLCNESYVDSDLYLGNITDCTHALIGSESSGHTGVGYNQNSLTLSINSTEISKYLFAR